MGLASEGVVLNLPVRNVADRFRHDAERQRGLDPTHGACERYSNKLGLAFELGQQSSESWTLGWVQTELVEAVLEVLLATTHGPELGVGVTSNGE